ncbi:MAG: tetratricopeptide repeat protein [Gammaproteobacteria bacterium]|nr:tetratricopeptide repeat protein [Gammaproteobacteria bacterium]
MMNAGERWQQLVGMSDEALDLAEAALTIAQQEYPHLNIASYMKRLDELADAVRARVMPDATPEHIVATMNHYFFKEQGFTGNNEDYYDPRNSFLNEVLDRKLGIPITLSIVYMEVGRRLDLPLEGIAFPGHFLVKLPLKQGNVILDPYLDGISLSEEDLHERLRQVYGEAHMEMSLDRLLDSANKKEILARILRNLKTIYLRTDEFDKALSVVERILSIAPHSAEDLRDRGLIYQRLECVHAALEDLRNYFDLAPDASDAVDIRARIIELQGQASTLH